MKIFCTGNPSKHGIAQEVKKRWPDSQFASRSNGFDFKNWNTQSVDRFSQILYDSRIFINLIFVAPGIQECLLNKVCEIWMEKDIKGHVITIGTTLEWEPESVIEELHEIMMALTPTVNALFPSESPLHFWGISLWKDIEGYYVYEHKDNTDLHSVIHVYLDSEGPCPGTVFQHAGSMIDINYVPNTGYIYCNDRERLTHNIAYPVPQGTVRYSLYAQWSLLPKYFPNAPQ